MLSDSPISRPDPLFAGAGLDVGVAACVVESPPADRNTDTGEAAITTGQNQTHETKHKRPKHTVLAARNQDEVRFNGL